MPTPLTLEEVPLKDLKPYPRNARTHSPGQVGQIVESIKSFGFTEHADISIFTSTMSGVTGSGDYRESMVSKIAQLQVIDILYSIFAVRNFGHAIETLRKTDVVTETTRY